MDKQLTINPEFLICDKRNSLNAGEREHSLLQNMYLMEALMTCCFDRTLGLMVYAGEQGQ